MAVPAAARRRRATLQSDALGKFGRHHCPAVEFSAIRHERSIAHGMDGSLFRARWIDIGGKAFKHDDIVLPDDI